MLVKPGLGLAWSSIQSGRGWACDFSTKKKHVHERQLIILSKMKTMWKCQTCLWHWDTLNHTRWKSKIFSTSSILRRYTSYCLLKLSSLPAQRRTRIFFRLGFSMLSKPRLGLAWSSIQSGRGWACDFSTKKKHVHERQWIILSQLKTMWKCQTCLWHWDTFNHTRWKSKISSTSSILRRYTSYCLLKLSSLTARRRTHIFFRLGISMLVSLPHFVVSNHCIEHLKRFKSIPWIAQTWKFLEFVPRWPICNIGIRWHSGIPEIAAQVELST